MTSCSREDHALGGEARAAVALSLLRGVGPVAWRERCERHGGAPQALDEAAPSAGVRDAALDAADTILLRMGELGGTVLVLGRPGYPAALTDLGDAPPVVYAVGDLGLLARPAVAIVGTRAATRYGQRAAAALAEATGRAGAVVVSGMARGIDAAAHRAALGTDAGTIAVLGTGVDVAYPRTHVALHREIAARGLLLAELPPGERADAGSFPRRNRIIAALAAVTVVVEAGHRSGALITASHAVELGRAVAAVPGPIDAPESAGANELLRDGAQVIATPADLLQLAGLRDGPPRQRDLELAPTEALVWSRLGAGAADLDALVGSTALPVAECLAAVGRLEAAGLIHCALTGEIRRR